MVRWGFLGRVRGSFGISAAAALMKERGSLGILEAGGLGWAVIFAAAAAAAVYGIVGRLNGQSERTSAGDLGVRFIMREMSISG